MARRQLRAATNRRPRSGMQRSRTCLNSGEMIEVRHCLIKLVPLVTALFVGVESHQRSAPRLRSVRIPFLRPRTAPLLTSSDSAAHCCTSLGRTSDLALRRTLSCLLRISNRSDQSYYSASLSSRRTSRCRAAWALTFPFPTATERTRTRAILCQPPMGRPAAAPRSPAGSHAALVSAPRLRAAATGGHSGKVLVAHGHVLNSQSDATVTRLASIMLPITAIAFILVFAMVATHPPDANVHETAAGATLKSQVRVSESVQRPTTPLSSDDPVRFHQPLTFLLIRDHTI